MVLLEIVSTITGIFCVWLQTRERILAWPFGIISVSIAAFIFFQNQLYSDFILHIIFFILNVYGWYMWSKVPPQLDERLIETLTAKLTIIYTTFIVTLAILWGFIMDRWTDADLPYFDSFTTSGSLVAQYLLAKKVLENWIIWIIVDVVAINMYLYKGLYYFAFLFLVYLGLCILGYRNWRSSMSRQPDPQFLQED